MTYYIVVSTSTDRVIYRSSSAERAVAYARQHGGTVYRARPGVGVISPAI